MTGIINITGSALTILNDWIKRAEYALAPYKWCSGRCARNTGEARNVAVVINGMRASDCIGRKSAEVSHDTVFPGKQSATGTSHDDTLIIARQKFPGSPASLDALCRRFGVDNSAREKHGALLDSEILAEVYLELVGGRQPDFALSTAAQNQAAQTARTDDDWRPRPREVPLSPRITGAEAAAHSAMLDQMGDAAIWKTRP